MLSDYIYKWNRKCSCRNEISAPETLIKNAKTIYQFWVKIRNITKIAPWLIAYSIQIKQKRDFFCRNVISNPENPIKKAKNDLFWSNFVKL